jgi:hypothetical protein
MTAATTVLYSWAELIIDPAWWYFRVVDFYADAFWVAGGGDLIVDAIESACVACGVPPLADSLSRQLASTYPSAHDQYRLVVNLGANRLWDCGCGWRLLEALRALVASGDAV